MSHQGWKPGKRRKTRKSKEERILDAFQKMHEEKVNLVSKMHEQKMELVTQLIAAIKKD
jgi:hypothetical protein